MLHKAPAIINKTMVNTIEIVNSFCPLFGSLFLFRVHATVPPTKETIERIMAM